MKTVALAPPDILTRCSFRQRSKRKKVVRLSRAILDLLNKMHKLLIQVEKNEIHYLNADAHPVSLLITTRRGTAVVLLNRADREQLNHGRCN